MSGDERAKLLERKARIDARLKELALADQKQKRKDDTRRKIIAGALVLEHALIKDDFASELAALLNRYVKRPEDRALFDFLDSRMPDVTHTGNEQTSSADHFAIAANQDDAARNRSGQIEPQQESA